MLKINLFRYSVKKKYQETENLKIIFLLSNMTGFLSSSDLQCF